MKILKANSKIILIAVIVIAAYFMFSKKGKELLNNSPKIKTTSMEEAWNKIDAVEFPKEVFYNGEMWQTQVKNYKGYDIALLADGNVVIYETGALEWVPASKSDLK